MENTVLTWRFLLETTSNPLVVPVSWHLVAVLAVLGVLGGLGLQHLFQIRFRFYEVHGKNDPVVAYISLVVLWGALFVMLSSYVVATHGEKLIQENLRTPTAQATASRLGQILFLPVFGPPPEDTTNVSPGSRAQLEHLLDEVSPETYRSFYQQIIGETHSEISKLDAAKNSEVEKGLPPPRSAAEVLPEGPPVDHNNIEKGEPSLFLIALALAWVTDPDQVLPESLAPEVNDSTGHNPQNSMDDTGMDSQTSAPPSAEYKPETTPESPLAESTPDKNQPPLVDAQGVSPPPPNQESTGTAKAPEVTPPKEEAKNPSDQSLEKGLPEAEQKPDPFATQETKENQKKQFPIPVFLANLVQGIPDEVFLAPQDWEYVAGHRLMEWVLEPMLMWQVGYSAVLAVVIALVGTILYFLLLRIFRRWLEKVIPQFDLKKTA